MHHCLAKEIYFFKINWHSILYYHIFWRGGNWEKNEWEPHECREFIKWEWSEKG